MLTDAYKDYMDAETLELLKSIKQAHPEFAALMGNDNPQTRKAWDLSSLAGPREYTRHIDYSKEKRFKAMT
jgi:hypothetical protein